MTIKNLQKLVLLLFFLFQGAFATDYYVSNSGSDNNNGTSQSSAWKTIAKVNSSSFQPGDKIFFMRGGIWREQLTVSSNGTATSPIVFGAYGSGNLPVIDAENVRSNGIYMSGKNYITIQNLNIKNATGSGAIRVKYGTGIIIENNEIMVTSHGGVFIENSANSFVRNNKIDTPSGSLSAQTDGIYSQRNTNNTYDGNNIVIRNEHLSPHVDGIQSYLDNGLTVSNNYIEQRNSKTYNSQGIYATTGAGSHVYYNNVVYMPNSDNALIGFRNLATGTATIKIYSNTLITGRGYSLIHVTDSPNPEIKNNIFQTNNPHYGIRLENWAGNSSNINGNLYYMPNATNFVSFNGSSKSWSQWKALGFESNGKNGNPALSTNFNLVSGSPAIDGGLNLGTSFNKDKNGNPRPQGSGFDIGAYEFGSTTGGGGGTVNSSAFAILAKSGSLSGSAQLVDKWGSIGGKVVVMNTLSGKISYTVNIPEAGNYYIWGRFFYHSAGGGANSFKVSVNNGISKVFGDHNLFNKFHWDGNGSLAKLPLGNLSKGTHTITVHANEPGSAVMLDVLVITSQSGFVPTDANVEDLLNGGGGSPDPVTYINPIGVYANSGLFESGASTVLKYGSLAPLVVYFPNMKAKITYNVTVPKDGDYYIWGRFFYYNDGSGANSFKVSVNGNTKVFGDHDKFNSWHWDGDGSLNKLSIGRLTAGTHQIVISANEPGSSVMLDMFALTNDPGFEPTDQMFEKLGKENGSASNIPDKFELSQNYPNPFNPSTSIKYSVAKQTQVTLKIYDILGAEVATLVNQVQTPGYYEVDFNAASFASGAYIYRIETKDFVQTKKMMLVK